MMKWFFFILLAVVVCSCGTTVYQLNTTCEKSNEEIFQGLSSMLLSSNFLIKQNDPKTGYLQAETVPEYNFLSGVNYVRMWTFQLTDSIPKTSTADMSGKKLKKMMCTARLLMTSQNAFGSTTGAAMRYYNDEISKEQIWYWDIRNYIQKMCSDIVIIEKEVNY